MLRRRMVTMNREILIQRWQRQLAGRTHIRYQELMHFLRQNVMIVYLNHLKIMYDTFETFCFTSIEKSDHSCQMLLFIDFIFVLFVHSHCWRRSSTYLIVIRAVYSLNLNGSDLSTKWPSMCT